jgi:hypothetical protein
MEHGSGLQVKLIVMMLLLLLLLLIIMIMMIMMLLLIMMIMMLLLLLTITASGGGGAPFRDQNGNLVIGERQGIFFVLFVTRWRFRLQMSRRLPDKWQQYQTAVLN